MISFIAVPKLFAAPFAEIQTNAIQSWKNLPIEKEIIIFGNDKGVKEAAQELGVCHENEIDTNEFGTPLLNSLFSTAEKNARYSIICFINSDIVLSPGFAHYLQLVTAKFKKFLMVGERLDLADRHIPLCHQIKTEEDFKSLAERFAVPHGFGGTDFFCFPKGSLGDVPPFAVGRPAYDHWLIWSFRKRSIPVVDASGTFVCIHQNHPRTYSSLKKEVEEQPDEYRLSAEGLRNAAFLPSLDVGYFTVLNASHTFVGTRIVRAYLPRYWTGWWRVHAIRYPFFRKIEAPFRKRSLKWIRFFIPGAIKPSIPVPRLEFEKFCSRFRVSKKIDGLKNVFHYRPKPIPGYYFKVSDYHQLIRALPDDYLPLALLYLKTIKITFLITWITACFHRKVLRVESAKMGVSPSEVAKS